jgi:hypothetical protein
MRTFLQTLTVVAALVAAGCSEPIDLAQNLEVIDVTTGWYDEGVVNGMNKLVPSVTFKFKNNSGETLNVLQSNVKFTRVSEDTEWSTAYVKVTGSEGLAPGATSRTQVVHAEKGYTGTETRAQMMANSQFVDGLVEIFAKYGSTLWVSVGRFPIERRVIEH